MRIYEDNGKWTVSECVVSQEQYDGGPFEFGASYEEGSLNKVIESLIRIRESIPEEFRDTATCEISSASGYDYDHYASINVRYVRPATDEEIAQKKMEDRARSEEREKEERRLLAALKRKYKD